MTRETLPRRAVSGRLFLLLIPTVLLAGCGGDSTTGNGGSQHSAIVRFVLTPSTGRALDIADVTMTFHSFEPAGDCTTVLYDADDNVWGAESFARFQIPDDTFGCIAVFEAGIQGYSFAGNVNPVLLESGAPEDLVPGAGPFATGYYYRTDDASVSGTFDFYVDELTVP